MFLNSTYKHLTKGELAITKELVHGAISKAVLSMQRMLQIPLRSDYIDFGNGSLEPISEFDLLGRFKVHLIRVVFKGDIKGAFYFAINGHEVHEITRACLPENIHSKNTPESKMMKLGFMVEIENMIAELAITEISDFLGVHLIGDVPTVKVMKGKMVNDYLREENEVHKTAFYVKSVL